MDRKKVSEKKFGFFQSETGYFEKVASLKKKKMVLGVGIRSPFSLKRRTTFVIS